MNGFLERLHPLTKLALLGAALLIAFGNIDTGTPVSLVTWSGTAFLIILVLLNGWSTAKGILQAFLLALIPITISLILVQGFFFPQAEDVLFTIGPLAFKSEGLYFGAVIITRLALILMATLILVRTTVPADLALALTQIGIPREIAYIILSAMQLVPRMRAKAESITNAQRARGLATEGNVVVRIRALFPLIAPLITSALQETEERALALEVRAFRAPGPKTSWRQLQDSTAQRVARWGMVLGAVAVFVWQWWVR
jgi:energy-coupling factor transport system permease protein